MPFMQQFNPNEEPLSGNPAEALRLENELMKLKLQAEYGASFGGDASLIPPDVENQWLRNMMVMEEQLAKEPSITLEEHLGKPALPASCALESDEACDQAWQRLKLLMADKGICVEFLAPDYPGRLRYEYVVGELFPQKIHPPMLQGQFLVFTYEDAHPNHYFSMEQQVHELFRLLSLNDIQPPEMCIAETVVTADGQILDQTAFAGKLAAFHEQFASVSTFHYNFGDRSRQAVDEELPETDLGYIEGMVKYEVMHHDGSRQVLEGPFKMYLQYCFGWWEIFFFQLYGFSWA